MLWIVVASLVLFKDILSASSWFEESVLRRSTICPLIPQGHMLPFGYHKQPMPPIDVISNSISPNIFDKLYVQPPGHRPGVFRELQSSADCTKWSDTHLDRHFGHYKVLTEVKHEQRQNYGKSLNTISSFLKEYNTTNQYIVTVLPDDMRQDVLMPQFLQCGTYSQNLLELNLWMASGNTASQLHYDADHNVHCLVAGKKSFFMIHPDQYHKLPMERLQYTGSNFCPEINQNKVDMLKHSAVSEVDYQWVVLHPGDCIFIPAQYMHQVRSYGRSISVTILWDPSTPLSSQSTLDCLPDKTLSIADFNVVWNHKADDIFFDVGYATPHVIRDELEQLWEEWAEHLDEHGHKPNDGWTYDQFISLMFSVKRWEIPECTYTRAWVAVIAHSFDSDSDLLITLSELQSTSEDQMKALSHFIDAPNLDYEMYDFCQQKFYYVPPEALTEAEAKEIKALGSVVIWLELNGYKQTDALSDLFSSFLDYIREMFP